MFFGDYDGDLSYLSPFSDHPILSDKVSFKSVYHYYTYHKFNTTNPALSIMAANAKTRRILTLIGNDHRHKITPDWDMKKYDIMKRGYELKFQQHPIIKKSFMCLKNVELKYSPHVRFNYWGHNGKNMMGVLLKELKTKYVGVIKPEPVVATCKKIHVLKK
jgi:predicted NAD-dependent protein-ADP-ribosyltransferase YbiA (DUF1768 family)